MDGITILSKTQYHNPSLGAIIFVIMITTLLFASLIGILVQRNKTNFVKGIRIQIFAIVCATIFCWTCLIVSYCMTEPYYEYEMQVDDTVSLNEFLSKYDIIQHHDNIYFVRDRRDDNNDW